MSLKTVKLATGVECLADPSFIVEMKGAYYVAVAVLEYDELQAGSNQTKRDGVGHVRRLFEQGYRDAPLRACPINSDGTLPYRGSSTEHMMRSAAAAMEPSSAAATEPTVSRGWLGSLAAVFGIGRSRIPPPPKLPPINPLPTPPSPPPPPAEGPLGMQTEPPGMQTSP